MHRLISVIGHSRKNAVEQSSGGWGRPPSSAQDLWRAPTARTPPLHHPTRCSGGVPAVASFFSGGSSTRRLQIGGIRTDLHLLAPHDLTMVADVDGGEHFRVRERCEDPSANRRGHIDDPFEPVGKNHGDLFTRKRCYSNGTFYEIQITSSALMVKREPTVLPGTVRTAPAQNWRKRAGIWQDHRGQEHHLL